MNKSPEEVKKSIILFLQNNNFDQPIRGIATHINKSRMTTTKYLSILVAEKKVVFRREGNLLLYSLSQENNGVV